MIEVGDTVAIRGDRRTNGKYAPEQLIDGKYVKHMGTGVIWTGTIEKVDGDMALCAGGWRGLEMYEVMAKKGEPFYAGAIRKSV